MKAKKTKPVATVPTEKADVMQRDARGRVGKGNQLGQNSRWSPGVSGNPAGSPRARRAFEEQFFAALIGEGSAEEAAKLLWEAARERQSWAITALLQRLAPQTQSFRLVHEKGNDHELDYSKLSDEQLRQLEGILETAGVQSPALEGGEGAEEPA